MIFNTPSSLAKEIGVSRSDMSACIALLAEGSKSFHAAAQLLPRRTAARASVFYAFCRIADDAVDEADDPSKGLVWVEGSLDRIFGGGSTQGAVERSLARLVESDRVPRAIFDALVEGFAWDAVGREYETEGDLLEYCVRVAGTVGAMLCYAMRRTDHDTVSRGIELGVAMQLTNIARDVGADANLGRVYIPNEWLSDRGIKPTPEGVLAGDVRPVVKRLLSLADVFYGRADVGITRLPRADRPAIAAARLIYADIGKSIQAIDYDTRHTRAFTTARRKLVLATRALGVVAGEEIDDDRPPLAEARFLVDAIAT